MAGFGRRTKGDLANDLGEWNVRNEGRRRGGEGLRRRW